MRYRFYLNQQQDEKGRHLGFDGYQPGHKMQLVYRGQLLEQCVREGRPSEEVRLWHCEQLYRIFNIHRPDDYRNRSMSVGDVVLLMDGTDLYAYACASFGFEEIDSAVFAQENAYDLVASPANEPRMTEVVTPKCSVCGQYGVLNVEYDAWEKWRNGTLMQKAFPDMPRELREQLMSGIHPACWQKMFPPAAIRELEG
jgi:hypothetical protein